MKWSDVPVWFRIIVVIAMINFFSFVSIAAAHGEDAINGYKRDGKYFVCQHGGCTEVSRNFWWYSYWHCISMWITHSTALIGSFIFVGRKLTNRLTNR